MSSQATHVDSANVTGNQACQRREASRPLDRGDGLVRAEEVAAQQRPAGIGNGWRLGRARSIVGHVFARTGRGRRDVCSRWLPAGRPAGRDLEGDLTVRMYDFRAQRGSQSCGPAVVFRPDPARRNGRSRAAFPAAARKSLRGALACRLRSVNRSAHRRRRARLAVLCSRDRSCPMAASPRRRVRDAGPRPSGRVPSPPGTPNRDRTSRSRSGNRSTTRLTRCPTKTTGVGSVPFESDALTSPSMRFRAAGSCLAVSSA